MRIEPVGGGEIARRCHTRRKKGGPVKKNGPGFAPGPRSSLCPRQYFWGQGSDLTPVSRSGSLPKFSSSMIFFSAL